MSGEVERAALDAGAALAEIMPAPAARDGHLFGTVTAVSSTAMSVDVGGSTLAGLPMTTACSGAAVGDRCLLAPVGSTYVVVGVIAR